MTSLSQYDIVPKEVNYIMIDYRVSIDKERGCFVINGPFDIGSIPISIPDDDPNRKQFVDLFLHKADIERGIEFLMCISSNKDTTVNEGLFIAGLNNCMKCFKYSKARNKLDKTVVFSDSEELFDWFEEFEKMRDKHFDHDESGMLQATAFLLVCSQSERIWGGPPSVVWNRAKLDYYTAGQKLQKVMRYTQQFLCKEIDKLGRLIEATYSNYSKDCLMAFATPQIELASSNSVRK